MDRDPRPCHTFKDDKSTETPPDMLNSPPEPPGKSPSAFVASIVIMAAIITPLLILSQVAAHLRTDVVDDQMFAYYGWRIAHGGTVYLDVWDNKPPGIYWINALGFLMTDTYMGVVTLCALAVIIAYVCFYIIASSVYFPAAAAVATTLASFFITHARYQGGSNRTETFLVPCELAAVAFYVRGFARDRNWKWIVSGLCCGGAVLFKQVGVAALGAMGLHLIWLMILRKIPFRTGVRRGLLILVGFGITVSIAAAYLASQHALGEAWFATVTFNQSYFNVGDSGLTHRFVNQWKLRQEMYPILLLPTLMAIATLIHAALWAFRPQLKPVEIERPVLDYKPVVPNYLVLFGLWMLIAFYGATISPHAFRHYIIPFIPPLMLFSAYIINLLQAEASLLRRLQNRAWVTAGFVIMGYFASDAAYRQWEEVSKVWNERDPVMVDGRWKFRASEVEELGNAVARVTGPNDTLQCWGYMPGVYLQARRNNVCRFTTTEKIGQVRENARFVAVELREKLTANPPMVFVLSSTDWAWITGVFKDNQPDELGKWLAEWLQANYEQVDDVRNIYVMKRKK